MAVFRQVGFRVGLASPRCVGPTRPTPGSCQTRRGSTCVGPVRPRLWVAGEGAAVGSSGGGGVSTGEGAAVWQWRGRRLC
jgi:hypothetical protein